MLWLFCHSLLNHRWPVQDVEGRVPWVTSFSSAAIQGRNSVGIGCVKRRLWLIREVFFFLSLFVFIATKGTRPHSYACIVRQNMWLTFTIAQYSLLHRKKLHSIKFVLNKYNCGIMLIRPEKLRCCLPGFCCNLPKKKYTSVAWFFFSSLVVYHLLGVRCRIKGDLSMTSNGAYLYLFSIFAILLQFREKYVSAGKRYIGMYCDILVELYLFLTFPQFSLLSMFCSRYNQRHCSPFLRMLFTSRWFTLNAVARKKKSHFWCSFKKYP
jgi:hypothetical protein